MSDSGGLNGAGGRLSVAEAAELSRQIGALAQAGLPLAQGLVALGEELPRGRLRRSMNQLAGALESGATLDQALEDERERIPPHLRGLVIAGMRSGRLGDVLSRFSQYVAIGSELKRRLWLSLAYPILTVSIAAGLVFFVCLIVVSQFEDIYRGFNLPLPRLTIAMVVAARIVNRAWPPTAIAAATIVGCWVAARFLLSQRRRRSLAGRVPLVGTVWRAISLAEYCHLLALLLESLLPLPEALRLTGEGVQDADVDTACELMAVQVESGRSLAQAMDKVRLFPRGLSRLVGWAENEKSLPEVLHMAGAMFESRARTYSAFVVTVLNVICVLLVFLLVMIVPAVFMPLISLISRLAG